MLIGRTAEVARLNEAILGRHSLLVCGPADSGKSVLLAEALSSLPAEIRRRCILCSEISTPHVIFQSLTRSLADAGASEIFSRVEAETGSAAHLERWLCSQTSLRLRGILRQVTRNHEYSVFLDAATPLPDGTYRLLQEWVWSGRTPVILLGRGSTQPDLGKAARLYWHDGLRLTLDPLDPGPAEALLQHSIARFHLTELADAEFRDFVLRRSEYLPGRIIRLCELASHPSYHYDGRIKLHTLALDFLLQQGAVTLPGQRATHHA